MRLIHCCRLAGSAVAATLALGVSASADPLAMTDPYGYPNSVFRQVMPEPSQDQAVEPSVTPERFRRQLVAYNGREAPGTIIIDTPHTYLYYVVGGGQAIRYGIGVGRDGFTWSGVQTIARKQEWPDWHPPEAMLARQPYLPRMMAGGPGNPLGARAMYLGNTEYRIHGTNAPETIGQHVSSGCIRLTNEDVIDLFNRVTIGSKVVVMPDRGYRASAEPTYVPARAPAPRATALRPHVSVGQPTIAAPRPVAQATDGSRTLVFGSRIY